MDETVLSKLERLTRLRDSGALSASEFEAEKAHLLGRAREASVVGDRSGDDLTASSPAETPSADGYEIKAETERTSAGPVWARKKARMSVTTIALILLSVFVVTLAASLWFLDQGGGTERFVANGVVNVRDAPTARDSRVIGRLAGGQAVTGRQVSGEGREWIEISEGEHKGGFVWGGNLVGEGPNAETSDRLSAGDERDPVVAALMERHEARGQGWREVSGIGDEHAGRYSMRCDVGGPEYRGSAMRFWWGGAVDQTDTYRRILRSGSRYILIGGTTYFTIDFSGGAMTVLETVASGRSVPVDRSIHVPRCGDATSGDDIRISRRELFTTDGLLTSANFARADCADLIAAKHVLTCTATVLGGMPSASGTQRVRSSLAASDQQATKRCGAQARQSEMGASMIVQQTIGDVYQTVASQAVYGGDMSEQTLSLCMRGVVGSMAGAGLLR